MRNATLALPTLATLAATRGMLGAGLGLLLGERLPRRKRRMLGKALLAVGIASTIPLAVTVFGER